MRLAIRHTTRYEFTRPVTHSVQRLRLTPRSGPGQSVIDWGMEYHGVTPELSYQDHNGNTVTLVSVDAGTAEVAISCHGEVDTEDRNGIVGRHAGHLPLWRFLRQSPLTEPGPAMRAIAEEVGGAGGKRLALLHRLSARIRAQVQFTKGVTDTRTTAEEACAQGGGVCQDHAHVFIGIARLLDIPARYVSGYLMVNTSVDLDASHGWAEGWVDGLGWVGFDVANGISPDARYVRVATGGDYREAAPVMGISFGAGTRDVSVEVSVAQQQEDQQQ